MRYSALIPAVSFVLLTTSPAVAQQAPVDTPGERARAEVLVLGVYHMSNPGRDVFNTVADDVLSPQRQAEMEQVTAALERFPISSSVSWPTSHGNSLAGAGTSVPANGYSFVEVDRTAQPRAPRTP